MKRSDDELTVLDKILVGLLLIGITAGLLALAMAITIEDWWLKHVGRYIRRNNMHKVR